jgi:hypothetical protein
MYRLVKGAGVIAPCRCWALWSKTDSRFSAVSGTEASGSLKHDSTDPRASKWKEAAVKALVSGRIAGNYKQLRRATQRPPEILFASY